MERFWEFLCDTGLLLIKAFIIFAVIRVLAMIFGMVFYVPYFDELMYKVIDFVGQFIPGFNFRRY
jgi:hypothetical protein